MEFYFVCAIDKVVSAPPVAKSVRAACHKPVQDGQEKRPLNIEEEKSFGNKPLEDLWNTQLFPQPLENESGAYHDGLGSHIASAGEDEQGLFGKTGQGANQGLDFPFGLHFIESAESGDYPLVDLFAFAAVFNDLEIFILTGFFGSSKHAEASRQGHFNFTCNKTKNQQRKANSVAPHF